MTVTLHLTPELEAGLSARSRQSGWVLEDYLLTLIENAAVPPEARRRRPIVQKQFTGCLPLARNTT